MRKGNQTCKLQHRHTDQPQHSTDKKIPKDRSFPNCLARYLCRRFLYRNLLVPISRNYRHRYEARIKSNVSLNLQIIISIKKFGKGESKNLHQEQTSHHQVLASSIYQHKRSETPKTKHPNPSNAKTRVRTVEFEEDSDELLLLFVPGSNKVHRLVC